MRRTLSIAGAALLGVLLSIWAVPAVSDADSGWLKEQPARGRNVDVGALAPGSTPPGVRPPAGGPPPGLGGASRGRAVVLADEAPDRAAEVDSGSDRTDAGSPGPGVWSAAVVVDAGLEFNLVGAVAGRDQASGQDGAEVAFRTSSDGATWSEWMALNLAPAPGDLSAHELMAEPLWVGHGRYVQFATDRPVKDLKLAFVNSLGEITVADRIEGALRTAAAAIKRITHSESAVAQTGEPAIVTRSQWGADESLRRDDPEFAPVQMAFVHHTAGGNGYSRGEAPAVVRAIYYYHVRSVGFDDIGYNFLIDRYGKIYEGRYGGVEEGAIGAHVFGFNTGSTGVALIGSFSSSQPPTACRTSLKKLLAWKLDVHHVKPTSTAQMTCRADEKYKAGRTVAMAAISGHRNANFTSCPGSSLYAMLPGIRLSVAGMGRPKVYAPAVSAALISPDGDGRGDATTITFSASEKVTWLVRITAPGGTLVRSLGGSGATASLAWSGEDDSGEVLPDGAYAVEITARSSRGAARAALLEVVVDTERPRIEGLAADPSDIERADDGGRVPTLVSYAVSEPVRTRITIRHADGTRAATVSGWKWMKAGRRQAQWNGNIEFMGEKIPAPDGAYSVMVNATDRAGSRDTGIIPVTCSSDPARWASGATFVTRAVRNFSIRRGRKATFRFKVLYAPGAGESVPSDAARVVLKIRDSKGRSRHTRILSAALNTTRYYRINRCRLPRGSYRYYAYATLPDGRRQQMAESGRLVIR